MAPFLYRAMDRTACPELFSPGEAKIFQLNQAQEPRGALRCPFLRNGWGPKVGPQPFRAVDLQLTQLGLSVIGGGNPTDLTPGGPPFLDLNDVHQQLGGWWRKMTSNCDVARIQQEWLSVMNSSKATMGSWLIDRFKTALGTAVFHRLGNRGIEVEHLPPYLVTRIPQGLNSVATGYPTELLSLLIMVEAC